MRNRVCLVLVIGVCLVMGCQRNVIQQEPPPEPVTRVPPDLSRNPDLLLQRAAALIDDFSSDCGAGVRSALFAGAAGVAVIPAPGEPFYTNSNDRGPGVLLTRSRSQWSLPVFVSVSGSGPVDQIGVRSPDVLLVFRNRETISRLRGEGSLSLNGLTSALGPIGPSANLSFIRNADVVAYKRTGGQFVGFYASRGVLSINPELTLASYTSPQRGSVRGYYAVRGYHEDEAERLVNALMNLEEGTLSEGAPKDADRLRRTLERMSDSNP